MSCVLSIDIGTSSVRTSLCDLGGRALSGATQSVSHSPDTFSDGGVEMDADALVERVCDCLDRTLDRATAAIGAVKGVGICSYWHSVLGVNQAGRAVSPILVWADTRSIAEVEELKSAFDVPALHRRTGCLPHTSYLPARLRWVRRHRPDWWSSAHRWMSPGEYLTQRLLGKPLCSVSMASATGLYHEQSASWDAEVLQFLSLPAERLGEIRRFDQGEVGLQNEFGRRYPQLKDAVWFPAVGDGACSNVGVGCVRPERVAMMVGTSGAMRVMKQGDPPPPPAGLWRYRWDHERFLLGGALSNGGNLFAWLKDSLQTPSSLELEVELAAMEPDAHGLTVLPFLAGERCPGWRGDARAAIVGLSWSTRPAEIVRAGLEAVAYRFALIHELLADVLPAQHEVLATGGALLASRTWTQIIADVLGRPVLASREDEATSRGAALLAWKALGLLGELDATPPRVGSLFEPDPRRYQVYQAARERQAALYDRLIRTPWSP